MGRGSVKVKKAGREEDYWPAFFFVESVEWPLLAKHFTLSASFPFPDEMEMWGMTSQGARCNIVIAAHLG
jgi:hypothetical protein